jgi:hypothetical protein
MQRFLQTSKFVLFLFFSQSAIADTLIKTGCSKNYPGVQWFIYEDVDGNRYSTKDPRSWECGFRRYMNLTMEKEAGDRFHPAIINVDYKDMLGREEPWGMIHHKTTIGRAEREGCCTVKIYGDGRVGEGVFTLGVTEIQYHIQEEPRCPKDANLDCMGYHFKGPTNGFIYYGEEDETTVTWELGVLVYASHSKYGKDTPIELMREYPEAWNKWQKRVDQYNEIYEKSGVYVRYELKELWLSHYHKLKDVERQANQLSVDVVLAHGTSYPDTCGVAHPNRSFKKDAPPVSMSRCTIYTDLHEIGHSVGLAHGPENQYNEASGYIFPEFGHGWNDICGVNDDIMSYGFNGNYLTNSDLMCADIFSFSGLTPAGYRDMTDTAYALNRVRYDVALINNDEFEEEGVLRAVEVKARRIREVIID